MIIGNQDIDRRIIFSSPLVVASLFFIFSVCNRCNNRKHCGRLDDRPTLLTTKGHHISPLRIMHRPSNSHPPDADVATILAELTDDFEKDLQVVERLATSLRAQLQELEERQVTSLTSADVRAVVSDAVRLEVSEDRLVRRVNSMRFEIDGTFRLNQRVSMRELRTVKMPIESDVRDGAQPCPVRRIFDRAAPHQNDSVKSAAAELCRQASARLSILGDFFTHEAPV